MFRSGFVACLALVPLAAPATAYEIKPKTPETAFSAKLQPDIIGLSSATEGGKALSALEAHLKDLPGVKPDISRQKFGGTNVTYVTSMKFASPPTANHPGESLAAWFTSPASGNRAYYISRSLGFANDRQPSKAEVIERVTAKYGDRPTLIGNGRIYYFYKGGKIVSVKQKYTPASALEALNGPINPKAALALNNAQGRGSCVAALKHAHELDKTLAGLLAEARSANCDGLVAIEVSPGVTADRVGKADFTLVDFRQIASAAKIDDDALAAEKNEALNKTQRGNAPKL